MIWTSKWRIPNTRLADLATTATPREQRIEKRRARLDPRQADGKAQRNSSVLARSCSSVSAAIAVRARSRARSPPELYHLAFVAVEQGLEKGHTSLQPFGRGVGSSRGLEATGRAGPPSTANPGLGLPVSGNLQAG